MKLLKITLSILAVLLCAAPSYPVSITAGLTAWYSMWWPEFEESFRGSDNAVTASDPENMSSAYGDSFSADQCFMAGPVVGLKFSDRWSMGLVFLAGTDVDVTSSFKVKGPLDTYTYHYDFSFRRYDSDLTLTYRVNSNIGIFAGAKYLRWDNSGTIDLTTGSGTYKSHTEAEVTGQCLGPAIGMSVSHPVSEVMYFTGSMSVMYLRAQEDQDNSLSQNSGPAEDDSRSLDRNFFGMNAMAGVGYYFSPVSTTVILGGRLQYLNSDDEPRDIFCGVTLSAIYSF